MRWIRIVTAVAVLAGVVIETRGLWKEGVTVWISDAGMRLVFGACVAALCAAPYFLVARASRIAGPPMVFAFAGALMITIQLCLTAWTLLFNKSSTAGLALMFMPVYLSIPAFLLWAGAIAAADSDPVENCERADAAYCQGNCAHWHLAR